MRVLPPSRTLQQAKGDFLTGLAIFGGLAALGLYRPVTSMRERGDRFGLLLCGLFLASLFLYLTGNFLWQSLGREQWEAGPDSLEVSRSLFGCRWRRRYQGASLALQQVVRTPFSMERLVMDLRGKKIGLTPFDPINGAGDSRAVGDYLARWTGWPLHLP
jgi:hypothetical protein